MRVPTALLLLLVFAPRPSPAYGEAVHALVSARVVAGEPAFDEILAPTDEADLEALRRLFHRTASALPDPALRAEFRARYPDARSFDAWTFKQFFMLDPAARVHGFDPTPDEALSLTREELAARASRWPDDDRRNQHRYLRDDRRQVVRGPDGEPFPEDPATLELGSLTGPSSQGHAHYGLLPGPLSDDPAVLRKDPRRFAVPPDAHSFGEDFAQLYTDLALLAQASDLRTRRWLAETFAGAAAHHLEDLANQIHTVQVGIYGFFQTAFLQSTLRDLVTAGGLFGPRRSLQQIGVRLVANHHLFSEDLFARRILEASRGEASAPEVRAALAGIGNEDPELRDAARAAFAEDPESFGRGLARSLIEISSREGPEIYQLVFRLTAKTLRDGAGHEYESGKDDPDSFLVVDSPERQRTLSRFYELEGRGLRRAGTALRLWRRRLARAAVGEPAQAREDAVRRMLAVLLPYQRAAAARRAAYVPPPPGRSRLDLRWAASELAAVLSLVAGVAFALRRRRAAR